MSHADGGERPAHGDSFSPGRASDAIRAPSGSVSGGAAPFATASPPPMKRARSACGGDDACSVASGSIPEANAYLTDSGGKRIKGHGPAHYINILNVPAVMRGDKLGVQEHRARLLLRTSPSTGSLSPLHNHMEIVDLAKKLSPGEVQGVPAHMLHRCLEEVIVKHGYRPYIKLQQALLQRKLTDVILGDG